jgi:hypothetical protein
MRRKVIIVSSPEDLHAKILAEWIIKEQLAIPILFDFHDFPININVTFNDSSSTQLMLPGGEGITESEIAGVWWRFPQRFRFSGNIKDPNLENFYEKNCRHLIQGFFEILGNKVVDPIFRTEAADRKLSQLRLAETCGLKIPPTCITNNSVSAIKFIESLKGNVIYKVFAGNEFYYTCTTLFEKKQLDEMRSLINCPLIFQQFIEGGFDIRVIVVGKNIFAARMISKKEIAKTDIRLDPECDIEPYDLPIHIKEGIHILVSKLGLRYAAIDMRTNLFGDHFFLELNPMGQYLFVETATNQPITLALANLLADPLHYS